MNMHLSILSHIRIHIALTWRTDSVRDVNDEVAYTLANISFLCDLDTVHHIALPQASDSFYLVIHKQLFEFCHL